MPQENPVIRQLLMDLRGQTVSLTLSGIQLNDQKITSIENGVVFTVRNNVARGTVIAQILSVDF